MFKRLLKLPLKGKNSIFLFGPRGTGKTFWLKYHLPDALYIDLLDFATYTLLAAQPHRLENLIGPNTDQWVIIDEVQRIPQILNEVHRLIESKGIRFILTGSSARSLRRTGANLLAGRALRYHMHPLVVQELPAQSIDMRRILQYGLLPAVIEHQDAQKYLESYVQTYIREEVVQEGLTRSIGAFSHFLEVASFSQGSVVNYSEIARELSINRLLVASYFEILEDLLLAIRIPVFAKRAKRKVIAHQKFYFFDTGIFNILRPTGPLDTVAEIDGAALETLFLQSVRAINDYYGYNYQIYYWRTQAGNEVDFVLYGRHGLLAFEIKRATTVSSTTFKGLKSFADDYPEAKLFVIYMGKHTEYHGPITVLPLEVALQNLSAILENKTHDNYS